MCMMLKNGVKYRKIPNVSPGLIEVFKHFLGGLYSGGLIFGGHFVLVSEYLNLLKLTDIVRQNNVIFTHNSINNNTPRIFNDYFNFEESNHQYQTVNSLNSTYSIPAGSLELPTYRTNSGKSSIKYICASTWNSTLKDVSMKYIERL